MSVIISKDVEDRRPGPAGNRSAGEISSHVSQADLDRRFAAYNKTYSRFVAAADEDHATFAQAAELLGKTVEKMERVFEFFEVDWENSGTLLLLAAEEWAAASECAVTDGDYIAAAEYDAQSRAIFEYIGVPPDSREEAQHIIVGELANLKRTTITAEAFTPQTIENAEFNAYRRFRRIGSDADEFYR